MDEVRIVITCGVDANGIPCGDSAQGNNGTEATGSSAAATPANVYGVSCFAIKLQAARQAIVEKQHQIYAKTNELTSIAARKQTAFHNQQQAQINLLRNSQTNAQAHMSAQFANTRASLARASANVSAWKCRLKAEEQARNEAERQRQLAEIACQEEQIAQQQLAAAQRELDEVMRQADEAQRQLVEQEAQRQRDEQEAARLRELQEAQRKAEAAEAQRQAALTPEQRQAETITQALKLNESFAVRVTKQAEEVEYSTAPLTPTDSNHSDAKSAELELADEIQQHSAPKPEQLQQALNIAQEALKKRLSLTSRAKRPDEKVDSTVTQSSFVSTTQPAINESNEQEQIAETPATSKPQVQQKSQKVVQEALKLRQSLVTARSLNSETKPDERNEALRQRDAFFSSQNQAVAIGAAASLSGTASQAGSLAVHIKNAIAALSSTATASPAGAMVVTIAAGFYHAEAGKGSDKVPGGKNFIKAIPAAMLNLPADDLLRAAAQEQRTVEAAIRGRLVLLNGEMQIQLLKTEQPSAIPVVAGVPDDKGHYQCILAGSDELPARTILVNPTGASRIDGKSAVINPHNPLIVVTGDDNQAQSVNPSTLTPYSVTGNIPFHDLIVVPGDGDKPFYVMLSNLEELPRVVAANNLTAAVVAGQETAIIGAAEQISGSRAAVNDDMASGREGSREAYSVRDDSRDATRWTGRTELPIANDDLIGGKLENPVPIDNTSKTLITPDQRDKQVASHTGNIDGLLDTHGATTVTPIPQGPGRDDLVYQANGRDNRLPIPEPTVASNGLRVESNSKHTPGGQGFRPNAGIEPRDSIDLFSKSVPSPDGKGRYSLDEQGDIHRFYDNNLGVYHWSGSTGDKFNAIKPTEIPNSIKKEFGFKKR